MPSPCGALRLTKGLDPDRDGDMVGGVGDGDERVGALLLTVGAVTYEGAWGSTYSKSEQPSQLFWRLWKMGSFWQGDLVCLFSSW